MASNKILALVAFAMIADLLIGTEGFVNSLIPGGLAGMGMGAMGGMPGMMGMGAMPGMAAMPGMGVIPGMAGIDGMTDMGMGGMGMVGMGTVGPIGSNPRLLMLQQQLLSAESRLRGLLTHSEHVQNQRDAASSMMGNPYAPGMAGMGMGLGAMGMGGIGMGTMGMNSLGMGGMAMPGMPMGHMGLGPLGMAMG